MTPYSVNIDLQSILFVATLQPLKNNSWFLHLQRRNVFLLSFLTYCSCFSCRIFVLNTVALLSTTLRLEMSRNHIENNEESMSPCMSCQKNVDVARCNSVWRRGKISVNRGRRLTPERGRKKFLKSQKRKEANVSLVRGRDDVPLRVLGVLTTMWL